jgi:hypothetical protein
VIYLDSSVALAHILSEDRSPPEAIWVETLVSSRLLAYEVWNRVYARKLPPIIVEDARQLLAQIELIELSQRVLARALEPFPMPVRALVSLHLATVEYLRSLDPSIALASFDKRMVAAARALRIPLYDL